MKIILFLVLILCNFLYANRLETDVRMTYINYDYDKGFPDAEAFASSLKIKYETEVLEGLSVGIALGTVQDLGILKYDKSEKKRNMAYIFNRDRESFTLLHQGYLKYKYSKSFIRAGIFELETPLLSSDDYFVLSNSFQGLHLSSGEIENFLFSVGYIDKMSGAWDASYDGGSYQSMTKQAWAHRADTGTEYYYNLVDDLNVSDAGVTFVGINYTNDSLKIQLYDHMLIDAYNSLFAQLDYIFNLKDDKKLLLAGQYIKYNGIGALQNSSNPDAVVDYATYSTKAELSLNKWRVKVAYTGVSDTPSIHFFGTAGGYPEFASGMMVSYFEGSLRDANIFSISPSLKIESKKNSFDFTALYAYYDLNSDYTKGGIIGDRINGDSYLHTYGLSSKYTYNTSFSWLVKLAQRRLEHGDKNLLLRTIVGYKF